MELSPFLGLILVYERWMIRNKYTFCIAQSRVVNGLRAKMTRLRPKPSRMKMTKTRRIAPRAAPRAGDGQVHSRLLLVSVG